MWECVNMARVGSAVLFKRSRYLAGFPDNFPDARWVFQLPCIIQIVQWTRARLLSRSLPDRELLRIQLMAPFAEIVCELLRRPLTILIDTR